VELVWINLFCKQTCVAHEQQGSLNNMQYAENEPFHFVCFSYTEYVAFIRNESLCPCSSIHNSSFHSWTIAIRKQKNNNGFVSEKAPNILPLSELFKVNCGWRRWGEFVAMILLRQSLESQKNFAKKGSDVQASEGFFPAKANNGCFQRWPKLFFQRGGKSGNI